VPKSATVIGVETTLEVAGADDFAHELPQAIAERVRERQKTVKIIFIRAPIGVILNHFGSQVK
jgi:hypothetical protein